MPLLNAVPIKAFPGNPWSAKTPAQARELITTWDLEELDALKTDPGPDLMWVEKGTKTKVGVGVVKVFSNMPQRMDYQPFRFGGDRVYNSVDVVGTEIKPMPFDLNFAYPMVFDQMGNGYKLMSSTGGGLVDFVGINGMAEQFVIGGRHLKSQLAASIFHLGLYSTALALTAPQARTYEQPNNEDGIALFTDGTGADGSGGEMHYSNPTLAGSPRFKNVYPAFGTFATKFGASLAVMAKKPHALLPNVTSGARVTDVFGPTHMRDQFFRMMVSDLVLQAGSGAANVSVAAVTNPYTLAKSMGLDEENFLGTAFGPRRFWILPQLDTHPYVLAHPTDGPDGGPADFWINLAAGPKDPPWAYLASNSKDFVPTFHFYGAGDPKAQSERRCRFETDLDGGAAAGNPGVIDMFFGI